MSLWNVRRSSERARGSLSVRPTAPRCRCVTLHSSWGSGEIAPNRAIEFVREWQRGLFVKHDRAGGIRTRDLLNPIQAHYQAVLRPAYAATIHRHTSDCQKSFWLSRTCLFSGNGSS